MQPAALKRSSALLRGAVLLCVLGGCSRAPAPPFPTWYTPPTETPPGPYRELLGLAEQTEQLAPVFKDRIAFRPSDRRAVLQALAKPLAQLTQLVEKPIPFPDRSRFPFEVAPGQRGWRLLGRCLVWRIEAGVADGNADGAITNTLVATRFGYDLTQGNASDASLGFAIVDEARQAMAPSLSTLSAEQLTRLGNGLAAALRARPSITRTLEQERRSMQAAVQFVQDSYAKGTWSPLRQGLDVDGREAVQYLIEMKDKDGPKREEYFRRFAGEIDPEIELLKSVAEKPVAARGALPLPPSEGRAWRRFARHFFRGARAILQVSDRTLAKTRLFVIECFIHRAIRENRAAPKSLSVFPADLTLDPYSGRRFVYRASGLDYRLYSIGADLRDDGGESDEAGGSPDLTLEGAS